MLKNYGDFSYVEKLGHIQRLPREMTIFQKTYIENGKRPYKIY